MMRADHYFTGSGVTRLPRPDPSVLIVLIADQNHAFRSDIHADIAAVAPDLTDCLTLLNSA
jgi:hypothetical protein